MPNNKIMKKIDADARLLSYASPHRLMESLMGVMKNRPGNKRRNQHWFDAGLAPQTVDQHQTNSGSTSRVW